MGSAIMFDPEVGTFGQLLEDVNLPGAEPAYPHREISQGSEVHFWTWKPAVKSYIDAVQRELLHREDGPAFRCYGFGDKNDLQVESWYRYGRLHREDGPAHRQFRHGQVMVETWLIDGELHREDGPALIHVDAQGLVTYREWAWLGSKLTEREWRSQSGSAVVL